jgi:hypothetical protein
MDKVDMVADGEMQRQVDGVTLIRRLRDEAKSILEHLDAIDEHGADLDWDLPQEADDLPELLKDLKEIEQSLLRIELDLQKAS